MLNPKRKLFSIKPDEVSLVGKPANQVKFLVMKGEPMDQELIKLLKSYFGEKWEMVKKEISPDAIKALKESLAAVNKYAGEFPEELKKAIGVLADYAASGYGTPAAEKIPDEVVAEAAAAEAAKKVAETAEEKKKRLAEEAAAAASCQKSADAAKQIETLTKSITDLTKTVTDNVASLATRLEAVEKTTAARKSMDGQDDKNVEKGDKGTKDNFPSIPI